MSVIDEIRAAHRQRCFAMEQRKRTDLSLGSFLRLVLGWRKDLPEDQRKAIVEKAKRLRDEPGEWAEIVAASHAARAPFETVEKRCVKEMERLAEQLPVWKSFGEPIRGFGAASLALIVAEAGDLADYSTDAKLWKRMGLGVLGGVRQGGLTKGAGADAWIEHGYNPARRSRMWNIGETLFKAQVRQVKDADNKDTGERIALGVYGAAYLRRKLHTQQAHPEWWSDKEGNPRVDDKTGRSISEHGNADAKRYMEKRLLRDLWRAWRRTIPVVAERPTRLLSAAELIAAE